MGLAQEKRHMPTAEDAGADLAQVYDEVRAAIALGETMFPRGATSTDKSMQRYHSGWKETHGLYQTNKALRGGHEVEFEAFFGQDVADGLQEWAPARAPPAATPKWATSRRSTTGSGASPSKTTPQRSRSMATTRSRRSTLRQRSRSRR